MEWVVYFNCFLSIIFFLCYSYQFFYVIVSFFKTKQSKGEIVKNHNYAVLISARNEEMVIEQLLQSINNQSYQKEKITVFVVADNCTDNTAKVSARNNAIVFRRFNKEKVGKGYALDFLIKKIYSIYDKDYFDGFFVFDADNVLDKNYIKEMNATFSKGYTAVTSYRNSKNFGANWISAGYGLWFLHEARHLNYSRMKLGTSCAISGTGFLISKEAVKKHDGWKYFLLTEDIEFTVDNIISGEKIGYCDNAVFYDEQPTSFRQSWNQRMRWAKGYFQVFRNYGTKLVNGAFVKHNFSCYDMTMVIMPAILLTAVSIVVNLGALVFNIDDILKEVVVVKSILSTGISIYLTLFIFGLLAAITEWKNIYCKSYKKILYIFTFPLFMLTYIPIAVAAVFQKVEWKPIKHTVSVSVSDITNEECKPTAQSRI
ncbi:MAG: glycosyltransferase family 2 protein [Oscillospiraceae bacterium]